MNYPQRALSFSCYSFVIAAFGVLLFATGANAASISWDGGGDGSTWSSAQCANWVGDACPGAADIATIIDDTVNVTEDVTVGELVLGDDSGTADTVLNFQYDAVDTANSVNAGFITTTGSGGTGDVTINTDAKVTHTIAVLSGAVYTIDMVVGGSMTVDAATGGGASIDVDSKGCPGDPNGGNGSSPSSSNVCGTNTGHGLGAYSYGKGGGAGGHGGVGGAGSTHAGGATYGSATNPIFFGSGAGSGRGSDSGDGGGVVILNVTGTLTLNGDISANGGDGPISGTGEAGGGGAGGSVNVTTATMAGGGNIFVDGGIGGDDDNGGGNDDGGGGGGGRIALSYATSSFTISSTTLSADGGTATGTAVAGSRGSAYTIDTTTSAVSIYHGFTYDDTDHSVTTWTTDTGATSQNCASGTTTPSITASGTLTFGGTLNCTASVTSFDMQGDTLSLSDNASITISGPLNMTADTDFSDAGSAGNGITVVLNDDRDDWTVTVPNGDSITFTDLTATLQSEDAFIFLCPDSDCDPTTNVDNVLALSIAGSSTVSANVDWQELSSFTLASGSSINATGKGCRGSASGGNGESPDSSNVCGTNTGHGLGAYSYGGGGGGGG
ncbi:hypothetical protein HOI83_00740, partial [Candidatus Uhrbacteria bacterium]|nr:hypothetical protein [Candidatus Uhrbacteria bacterium]